MPIIGTKHKEYICVTFIKREPVPPFRSIVFKTLYIKARKTYKLGISGFSRNSTIHLRIAPLIKYPITLVSHDYETEPNGPKG
jgi:hypothetical protein